ncbi:MAG TPA: iron-sulfur cluster-binding domain-containing protein [Kofleriaceae bacterium]|jgi:ferredoxin-NADP reductase
MSRSFIATAVHRLFLDRHAEFWLGELSARWSLAERRARVREVIVETPDTRTFVLDPGRRWPGHVAGQYVPVEVEIDGVRVRRCYSISSGASAPGARRIAITVRRVPNGKVSAFLHDHVGPGAVLGLGAPAGTFVVDESATSARGLPEGGLLLVGGGSGLTPIHAIVQDLAARGPIRDVVLVHASRADADALFWPALDALATQHPGLRLIRHRDATEGYLTVASLLAHVPDLASRAVLVCGPAGLMEVVQAAAPHARSERFLSPPPPRPIAPGAPVLVTLGARTVTAAGPGTLLDQLERAGERPAHGCRMGICNTCRCKKVSGTVEDAATGALSSAPDEDIRLCSSIARSDLVLA